MCSPAIEETFTIDPPPPLSIHPISCFMHRNVVRSESEMVESHEPWVWSWSSTSGVSSAPLPPTTLAAKSSRPWLAARRSNRSATASLRVTSQLWYSAERPCPVSARLQLCSRLAVDVDDHHMSPLGGKDPRRTGPDPTGSSGDQTYLAFESTLRHRPSFGLADLRFPPPGRLTESRPDPRGSRRGVPAPAPGST